MSTRDRILDAAWAVMRARGLAATTTKEIAKAAGLSEAALYKHFDDKQQLFIFVLRERTPAHPSPDALIATSTVEKNLVRLVEQLLRFYVETFPIAASIFSTPELLAAHREGIKKHGGGPENVVALLRAYLEGERTAGRIAATADADAVARLLAGASMQGAFFANYAGLAAVPRTEALARTLVRAVLPALGVKAS